MKVITFETENYNHDRLLESVKYVVTIQIPDYVGLGYQEEFVYAIVKVEEKYPDDPYMKQFVLIQRDEWCDEIFECMADDGYELYEAVAAKDPSLKGLG